MERLSYVIAHQWTLTCQTSVVQIFVFLKPPVLVLTMHNLFAFFRLGFEFGYSLVPVLTHFFNSRTFGCISKIEANFMYTLYVFQCQRLYGNKILQQIQIRVYINTKFNN